jgi:hypothetical protein
MAVQEIFPALTRGGAISEVQRSVDRALRSHAPAWTDGPRLLPCADPPPRVCAQARAWRAARVASLHHARSAGREVPAWMRRPAAPLRPCFPTRAPSRRETGHAIALVPAREGAHTAPSDVQQRRRCEPQPAPHVPGLLRILLPAPAARVRAPVATLQRATILVHSAILPSLFPFTFFLLPFTFLLSPSGGGRGSAARSAVRGPSWFDTRAAPLVPSCRN